MHVYFIQVTETNKESKLIKAFKEKGIFKFYLEMTRKDHCILKYSINK